MSADHTRRNPVRAFFSRVLPVRYVVTTAFVVVIAALTVGPVQAIVDHRSRPGDRIGGTAAAGPPACTTTDPTAGPDRGSIWSTAGTGGARRLSAPRLLTYAQAASTPAGDVHLVGGTVLHRRQRGVTAYLTRTERDQLAGLQGPGCASLRAVGDVLSGSVPVRTHALPAGPAPGTTTVAKVVTDEVVPGLNSPRGLVAALADGDGHAGLYSVSPAGLTPTVRGRVYVVVAQAVTRGTRDVTLDPAHDGVGSGLSVRAFLRPDGHNTLLAWDPGRARTVVVDVPSGRHVERYTVRIPAHALTTVVLPATRR